ncbi:MAG: hypothetical protein JWR89_1897 [Tardiphaga sp.]|jgi:hypothetical protein|uniref:hypothetical protein n=1 Tax=Tardiphaga sp. TaxID=1926292 RepID=UPI0026228E35|nr:hypothetical protein [Tardiphaga sp.]MDB5501995.1 hypothetical protein [Tardiphaga sp.]
MAKAAKKKLVRREYTKEDVKTLKEHSKAQTPLEKISKAMKRTGGSLRQKAIKLGIPLGHRRRKVKKVTKAAKVTKTAKTVKKAKKAKK